MVYFKYGYLLFITLEPANESYEIFKRFTKRIRTNLYEIPRFAKSRNTGKGSPNTISTGRVRARTMAMQKSDELSETSSVLFQQFNELERWRRSNINRIFDEDEKGMKLYSTFHGNQWNWPARIEFSKHRVYQNIYFGWKNQKKHTITELTGKELQDLNQLKLDNPDYQVSENELAKDHWVGVYRFIFKRCIIVCIPYISFCGDNKFIRAVCSVFDLTYRRFSRSSKSRSSGKRSANSTCS